MARVTQPTQPTLEFDQRFAKVKLCPLAGSKVQGHIGGSDRGSEVSEQVAYRRFGHSDPQVLELHPHAVGRPPLFGRPPQEPLILLEPALPVLHDRIPDRRLVGHLPMISTLQRLEGLPPAV